ncbi:MAG: DNA methyltransferase, partial [Cetobacterium sp.]
MSYINNNFLSNTFLKNWREKQISKDAENRINNLLYPFDILKEISKENRENLSEEQLKNWIYKNFIPAFGYLETENSSGIIEIYNSNKEKIIALDFKKEILPLVMEFGKYQDLEVIEFAKKNKFKLAILTDGYTWRIYRLDLANYFETYIEIDISNFLSTEEKDFSIQLLESFISYENLNSSQENYKSNLDIIFEESENTIKKIEKELKGKMEDILSGIALGFKEATGKDHFNEKESKNLYDDSIVVLYRTLFLIYAEAKNLLPTDNSEYYSFSISKIIENIEDELENNDTNLWSKLEKLFSWIDKGYEGANLKIEAYNGGLFNNNNKIYLGNFSIANRHLIKVFKKLGYYEKKEQLLEKIDFTDLSTRSFGTLYEGILDYNLFIASEDMIKRSKDSKVTYTPISKLTPKKTDVIIKTGEIYLSEDALERKETGAYYTPEPIVEYIVNNTVDLKLDDVLKEIQKEIDKQKEEIEIEYNSSLKSALQEKLCEDIINKVKVKVLKISILDNAMGSGHFLVNAAYHVAAKVFNFLHNNIKFKTLENEEIGEYSYWIRMAVTHNIYGVDINNLAVQLGKLSLWLISASKDKPLSFIDHHLKSGNSLVGANR